MNISREQSIQTGSHADDSLVYRDGNIYDVSSYYNAGSTTIKGSDHVILSDDQRKLSVDMARAISDSNLLGTVQQNIYKSLKKYGTDKATLNTIAEQVSDVVRGYYSSFYSEQEGSSRVTSGGFQAGVGLGKGLSSNTAFNFNIGASSGIQWSSFSSMSTHNKLDQIEADVKSSIDTLGAIIRQAETNADKMKLTGQQRDSFIYNEFTKAYRNTKLSGILDEIKEMSKRGDGRGSKDGAKHDTFDIPIMP